MQTNVFLHALDNDRIVAAILDAETRSRGEIRVHVTNQAADDVQAAARMQFEKLAMTKTDLRNGVLIYVAPKSQTFAVIGDAGIHERCGPTFWSDVASAMEADFRAGRFTDGIVKGVKEAGDALARYFPREGAKPDVNELPNEVTGD
jgi:uncharacterized membrane protein